MKGGILVSLGLLATALVGCGESDKTMSKEEAQKQIFAPTDLDKMSPEMRAKIPANGLGPADATATPPPGMAGAAPAAAPQAGR